MGSRRTSGSFFGLDFRPWVGVRTDVQCFCVGEGGCTPPFRVRTHLQTGHWAAGMCGVPVSEASPGPRDECGEESVVGTGQVH